MSQFDGKDHWVLYDDKKCRSRCKMANCVFFSHWFCQKCRVNLCVTSKRNCFYEYHHQLTEEKQITKNQQGKKKANRVNIAVKKNMERRSKVEAVSTEKIGCSAQSRKIKKPKQTAVTTKLVVRESRAVNVDENCDSSQDKKMRVRRLRSPSTLKFMSALGLCYV